MKTKVLIALFVAQAGMASAQQLPLYSLGFFAPQINNPARSGSKDGGSLTTAHRQQWMGVEGAPETSMLAFNSALNKEKIGFGLYAYNDVTDIVHRSAIYGNYAYHVQLADNTSLSFGLGLGYVSNSLDMASIRVKNADDPYLIPANNGGSLDLNVGVHLQASGFGLGFSAPQLLAPAISYSKNYDEPVEYQLIRHYTAQAQYDVTWQKGKMVLTPLVALRSAGLGIPMQVDAGALFNHKDFGYVGAMYRSNYAVTAQAGVHLTPLVSVGYGYDFSTNTYATTLGTTHEFMLTYRLGNNKAGERMEAEIKRLKDAQRKQMDQQENFINEKFEEFRDEIRTAQKAELEKQKASIAADVAKQTAAAAAKGGSSRNTTATSNSSSGGETPSGLLEGFKAENLAANVAPGSAGFYVTAGVFSTKENATKLQGSLKAKGLPSELFQDKTNSMYYVYILKFKSYEEAEAVKTNRLNGRFDGKLWVKVIE
jgi:type IX secretion system PorP/SprF family membrane protein